MLHICFGQKIFKTFSKKLQKLIKNFTQILLKFYDHVFNLVYFLKPKSYWIKSCTISICIIWYKSISSFLILASYKIGIILAKSDVSCHFFGHGKFFVFSAYRRKYSLIKVKSQNICKITTIFPSESITRISKYCFNSSNVILGIVISSSTF